MDSEDRLEAWLPTGLLAEAERLCAEGESLGDFILLAVEQEVRRRKGLRTYTAMLQLRARDAAAKRRSPRP